MSTETANTSAGGDRSWLVVGRVQEYEGERRANLLRIVGIALFYAVELLNRYGLNLGSVKMPPLAGVDDRFHAVVTSLAVVWLMLAIAAEMCLRNRIFPPWLMFATVAGDLILLTAILCIADGPKSPLVVGYFVILASAGLRLNVFLVRCATVGTLASYLYLSGFARWFTERDITVPRYEQVMVVLALGLCGVILGETVRNARRMAARYADQSSQREGGRP